MIGKFSGKANFDIEWVGALSVEEYEAGKEFIPSVKEWWWLRSPSPYGWAAAYVDARGLVGTYGGDVYYDSAVRPALKIKNLDSLNLRPGDEVEIAGITWTVISEDLVLADNIIGHTAFNHDYTVGNDDYTVGNEYVGSDLELYITQWWHRQVRNH